MGFHRRDAGVGAPAWVLGIAQVIAGALLIMGWAERAMVLLTTLGLCVLIVLVATGKPSMLVDPYGALIKDLCLIASGATVWLLAPMLKNQS